MGVFNDLGRLMRAGWDLRGRTDVLAALHESAELADQMRGQDPQHPAPQGAAQANPFANAAFMRQATPAAGTVVALSPADREIAGAPVYRVELDVRIDGQEPYRSTYETVIAAAALANWQPGSVLPFRVSPDDPHSLMLG